MLVLLNTNRMTPPIGPIGLDYVAGAARSAGIDVDVVDLCLSDDASMSLRKYFATHEAKLVGISLRNVDDCFWPSAEWFLPELRKTVTAIRNMTFAPIVLGGVGFSIFAEQIVRYADVEFGIRGDGEQAIVLLLSELQGSNQFEKVPGLVWRKSGRICSNQAAWPEPLKLSTGRDAIDNAAYFNKGGQCGIETKRGCNRQCIYCADPLAKGTMLRVREPSEVADEAENLLKQKIDVLHFCDSEFNIPREHAYAVCEEFIRRGLGKRLRWYTYMAVVPFDAELAEAMSKAGCVGIDFTGDSASSSMLKTYCQPHGKEELTSAVRLCRENRITVMIDLLFGGPGETAETVKETIEFIKKIGPDCAGTALGIRIYPNTKMAKIVAAETELEMNPNLHRKYGGAVDFFKPTFYISEALGERPDELIKNLVGEDKRFFLPASPIQQENINAEAGSDYNYNDNTELVKAIKRGARGAYWDILRKLRVGYTNFA